MMQRFSVLVVVFLLSAIASSSPVKAQQSTATSDEASSADMAPTTEELLTDAELQTLVSPVALFPDTLLIQIFVAATQPFEVMKAERFLLDNLGRDPAELELEIEQMGWDPSVTVLATAFPEVIGKMATHIDWTETVGTAMLVQSEDVLTAVQVMRDLAIDFGALVSGPEQTVEVEEEAVVIVPTNPEVVYVPQYVPTQVYSGPSAGDVIGTALITFGTIAIIDEIFDDDDDWNDYWGCRNCGGWNGQPIIRDPDIDIDIDGNVNIGNRLEIDRGTRIVDGRETSIGWNPDSDRLREAREEVSRRGSPDTQSRRLPLEQREGRTNELRAKLAERTGAPDISRDTALRDRPGTATGIGSGAGSTLPARERLNDTSRPLPQINRNAASSERTKARQDAISRTRESSASRDVPVKSRPSSVTRPSKAQGNSARLSGGSGKALKKTTGGKRARDASLRGKATLSRKKR